MFHRPVSALLEYRCIRRVGVDGREWLSVLTNRVMSVLRANQCRLGMRISVGTNANTQVTTTEDGRFMQEHITGAQLAKLDAAHLSNVQAGESFNQRVLAFLV